MKKLLYGILFGLVLLSSCSNKDNLDEEIDTLSIIGIWKPIKEVSICATGSEEQINFDSCIQTGRLIFKENGEFIENKYIQNINTNNCNLIIEQFGSWKFENNKLNIKYNYDNTFNEVPIFELAKNLLRIGEYSSYFECDTENKVSHYYFEYEKVE